MSENITTWTRVVAGLYHGTINGRKFTVLHTYVKSWLLFDGHLNINAADDALILNDTETLREAKESAERHAEAAEREAAQAEADELLAGYAVALTGGSRAGLVEDIQPGSYTRADMLALLVERAEVFNLFTLADFPTQGLTAAQLVAAGLDNLTAHARWTRTAETETKAGSLVWVIRGKNGHDFEVIPRRNMSNAELTTLIRTDRA
jgi:hypothetical protein